MSHHKYGEYQPLTVMEFIDILMKFPADLPIIVDGYEGGVGRITSEMVKLTTAKDDNGVRHPVVYIEREGSPDQQEDGLFHSWGCTECEET